MKKIPSVLKYIENKKFWNYSEQALRFVISDCKETIKLMPDNPKNIHGPGNYADQIHDAYSVLRYRKGLNK
tara:strand:+ start:134 stop:346 length:213 start_codon:yes stop_codon:yes gene_type:complete